MKTSIILSRIGALNYSSGTTGLPKGCVISLYNMVAYAMQMVVNREVGKQNMLKQGVRHPDTEIQLAYVPFYHASKLVLALGSICLRQTRWLIIIDFLNI